MMYERIGILAALSARVTTSEAVGAKNALGSATVGTRVAMLVRKCEDYLNASEDGKVNELASITHLAEACRLEVYVNVEGHLMVGRPHYFVNMGGGS